MHNRDLRAEGWGPEDCYHQDVSPYPRPSTCTRFKCNNCGKELQIDGTFITNKEEMLKCAAALPLINRNSNFSTWQGFGELWEWVQKQDWYDKFFEYLWVNKKMMNRAYPGTGFPAYFIHPDRFADALYQFLKERN